VRAREGRGCYIDPVGKRRSGGKKLEDKVLRITFEKKENVS